MATALSLLAGALGSRRPLPIPHAAIAPPFDPNDAGGIVHTTLPPEQIIPPHFTDPAWIRADFNGTTLDLDRWNPKAPSPLPFLPDANSTPLAMLMSPMLVLYPRYWQDAFLTEQAERGYDDFIFDCSPWNAPRPYAPAEILAWVQYLHSWGFRPVLWRGDPTQGLDTMFQTLIQSGLISFYGHGEEVDSKMTSQAYEASLQQIDGYLQGTIPIGVHFTADGVRNLGYPIGFPRDTFLNDWSPYNGRVHLCSQQSVNASAGLQGAGMYYARQQLMGIGDAATGPGAPDSRVIAWEIMATAQLYGRSTEAYGCLRSWELVCGTRDNPRIRPVSGFANGCRYPTGAVL